MNTPYFLGEKTLASNLALDPDALMKINALSEIDDAAGDES